MSASLISSLRALSLRTKPASRVLPTICRRQPTVRSISQSALAPMQASRRAITRPTATMAATMVQQQTRGMKVHSSVKKRCEHCKVSQCPKLWGQSMSEALGLCGGKPASDTGAIYTSFAAPTRDISSARANATAELTSYGYNISGWG
ncbi:hypothetical protein F4859DRAFT_334730 [Xylaria cf. heliscus]|nr:hypothetical protein F4859DRAFT_334730 [Xylaria cf. heliscus]